MIQQWGVTTWQVQYARPYRDGGWGLDSEERALKYAAAAGTSKKALGWRIKAYGGGN